MSLVDFHYPNGELVQRPANVSVPVGWRGPRVFPLLTRTALEPFHVFALIPVVETRDLRTLLRLSITFNEPPTHGTDRAEYILPAGWIARPTDAYYSSSPPDSVLIDGGSLPLPDRELGYGVRMRLRIVGDTGGTLRIALPLPSPAAAFAATAPSPAAEVQ